MHDYEIRILNDKLSPSHFVELQEASDAAAIRSAEHFANGRSVEVWRDIECIYRCTVHAPRSAA